MSILTTMKHVFGREPVKNVVLSPSMRRSQNPKSRYPANEGYRIDCPEIKRPFHSSMEVNTYRYLRFLKQKYGRITSIEYEPERFTLRANKYNIPSYIPDFKITMDTGVYYLEVKGILDQTSIKKALLLQESYNWIKLYFLLPPYYQSLRDTYKNIIPYWE